MKNDLIEDTGFELVMPTHTEMLQHYNRLLDAELETARHDLRKAHKDIAGLIEMHRDSLTALAALKVENQRLRSTLSYKHSQDANASQKLEAISKLPSLL